MSVYTTDPSTTPATTPPPAPPHPPRWRAGLPVLLASTAIAAVAAGGVAGYVGGSEAGSGATPATAGTASGVASSQDAVMNVPAVLARVEPSVVTVQTRLIGENSSGQPVPEEGTGTGFVVAADGVIATNNHVVQDAQTIEVTLSDGRTMPAQVLRQDPTADLAVLQIQARNLPVAPLGDSSTLEVGDPVVAIGDALALPGGPTVTEGIVSALDRTITTDRGATLQDVIQTDAAINPGNSGGPLVDATGHVVGIDTAAAGDGQNVGFAISISGAHRTLDALVAEGPTGGRPS
jgi:serine protease Do